MTTLSQEEAAALLAAARGDRWKPCLPWPRVTGMRRGELLALRWKDVGSAAATLSVRGTLRWDADEFGVRLTVAEPKTERSVRQIGLGRVAGEALQRRRRHQPDEELAAERRDNRDRLVFTTATGSAIDPGNLLRRSFAPVA